MRREAKIDASLRGSAIGRLKVEVTDISIEGCRVTSPFHLHVGEELLLVLSRLEPLGAKVAWCSYDAIGLRFNRPLAGTVVEHMLSRDKPPQD